MSEYLFIGGSIDGQVKSVIGELSICRVAIPPVNETMVANDPPPVSTNLQTETYILTAMPCYDDKGRIPATIFRHESLNLSDVLRMLVAGYKKKC
jgi:hypothetical protein